MDVWMRPAGELIAYKKLQDGRPIWPTGDGCQARPKGRAAERAWAL
jgi:hypothetical protein